MKKIWLVGITVGVFLVFWNSCSPRISIRSINHRYSNLSFSPEKVERHTNSGLLVTVVPIDAASINRETFEAASRDGNYEKELALDIEKREEELSRMSRADRRFEEGRINAIEEVNALERRGEISALVAMQLRRRIWYGEGFGLDGTEVKSLSELESYPDHFNPYRINRGYLSVFRVTFENKGNEIERVLLQDFHIISNEELVYPFGLDYFENTWKDEQEKYVNAYRMNMVDELVVSPGQRITKYIAVPAINPRNEELQVQIIRENEVVNFGFDVKQELENRNYQFEAFKVTPSKNISLGSHRFYYVVDFIDGPSYAAKGDQVYINQDMKELPANIHMIAVHNTQSNALAGSSKGFRFGYVRKNEVVVSFR